MKKLLNILIVFAVLFASGSVAEEKEATFRGIPWGSSVSDSINALKAEFGEDIEYSIEEFEGFPLPNFPSYYFGTKVTLSVPNMRVAGFLITGYYNSRKNRITGGYDTIADYTDYDNVVLYFIPKLNPDNTSYSLEDGKLFAAEYVSFWPGQIVYNDDNLPEVVEMEIGDVAFEIETKITKLYNQEPQHIGSAPTNTSSSMETETIWNINDTSIVLQNHYGEGYSEPNARLYGDGAIFSHIATSLYYCKNYDEEMSQISNIKMGLLKQQWELEQEQNRQEIESRGTDGL